METKKTVHGDFEEAMKAKQSDKFFIFIFFCEMIRLMFAYGYFDVPLLLLLIFPLEILM